MTITKQALWVLLANCFFINVAFAWDDVDVDRVAMASASFVESFNAHDAIALGQLYTRNGVLKLPNALAISGRDNVANAWQSGFDAGLDSLVLFNEGFEQIGNRRVLENGTYELTIQTPGGPIVQVGTFSVLWRVPEKPHRSPKIMFDTIDAD